MNWFHHFKQEQFLSVVFLLLTKLTTLTANGEAQNITTDDLAKLFPQEHDENNIGSPFMSSRKLVPSLVGNMATLQGKIKGKLVSVNVDTYINECLPEYRTKFPLGTFFEYLNSIFTPPAQATSPETIRTNWNLIKTPSGVCMDYLYCAFIGCNPIKTERLSFIPPSFSQEFYESGFYGYQGSDGFSLTGSFRYTSLDNWLDKSNPDLNLPNNVVFPDNVADVVHTVNHARKHNLQISTKTTGHCYTGCSTWKDSLLVNLRRDSFECDDDCKGELDGSRNHEKTFITNCTDYSADPRQINKSDLGNQACILAKARKKKYIVRVGAGDNWFDVYTAIRKFNLDYVGTDFFDDLDKVDESKFDDMVMVVGGAAATVSPFGWTFMGGMAGNAGGREHGFGIDQVLHIEMVTSDGIHVRFGPTNWSENTGKQIYPQTTTVSGLCNSNPHDHRESWNWMPCSDKYDDNYFMALWKSVRGAGGGFGIITAIYLQLHPFPGILNANVPKEKGPVELDTQKRTQFLIDFYLRNDKTESYRCGAPSSENTYCYGKEAQKLFEDRAKLAFGEANFADLYETTKFIDWAHFIDLPSKVSDKALSEKLAEIIPASDIPVPGYPASANMLYPVHIPLEVYKDPNQRASIIEITSQAPIRYWAYGGNTPHTSDGTDTVAPGFRKAGVMLYFFAFEEAIPPTIPDAGTIQERFYNYFSKWYDVEPGKSTKLPGFLNHNQTPNNRGPVKADWAKGEVKACPIHKWLPSRIEDECFSSLDAMFGEGLHKELQTYKKLVDSTGLFVGYNQVYPDYPTKSPTPSPTKSIKKSKKLTIF